LEQEILEKKSKHLKDKLKAHVDHDMWQKLCLYAKTKRERRRDGIE